MLPACWGGARKNLVLPTGGVKTKSQCQLGVGCLCSHEWRLERRMGESINLLSHKGRKSITLATPRTKQPKGKPAQG